MGGAQNAWKRAATTADLSPPYSHSRIEIFAKRRALTTPSPAAPLSPAATLRRPKPMSPEDKAPRRYGGGGSPGARSPLKMTWARRPSATAMERKSCARIWGGNCERGGKGKGGVGKGGQASAEGRGTAWSQTRGEVQTGS